MRVAVIGVGNMGRNHARIYSQLAELVAVSDVNEENGKHLAAQFNCRYYKNYRDLLDAEKPAAVSIAVPTQLHKEVALEVIKHKINLLIEKPIAPNVKDAREILDAANLAGVKLTVGHVERFNPAVTKLKEIIKSGALGEINSIIARRVGVATNGIGSYENLLIDLAIHDVDIINYLLEKMPTNRFCLKGKSINSREDYADMLLSYGNTNAFIQTNWITPIKIRTLHVTGSKGYADLDYISQDLKIYKLNYARDYSTYKEFIVKFDQPDVVQIEVQKEEPLKLELAAFLDCIKNNTAPAVTGEEALRALEIVSGV
jgi:UDP-N-acetylglucosamine 3-dehydrogenase